LGNSDGRGGGKRDEMRFCGGGEVNDKRLAAQKAYVTGAIFTSIAFLEATINEFFDDALDGPEEHLKALSNEEKAMLGATWREDLLQMARLPMINKFQLDHLYTEQGMFVWGFCRWQNAHHPQ
jgi:hypothetical protein